MSAHVVFFFLFFFALFHLFFASGLINSIIQCMNVRFYLSYDIKIT